MILLPQSWNKLKARRMKIMKKTSPVLYLPGTLTWITSSIILLLLANNQLLTSCILVPSSKLMTNCVRCWLGILRSRSTQYSISWGLDRLWKGSSFIRLRICFRQWGLFMLSYSPKNKLKCYGLTLPSFPDWCQEQLHIYRYFITLSTPSPSIISLCLRLTPMSSLSCRSTQHIPSIEPLYLSCKTSFDCLTLKMTRFKAEWGCSGSTFFSLHSRPIPSCSISFQVTTTDCDWATMSSMKDVQNYISEQQQGIGVMAGHSIFIIILLKY